MTFDGKATREKSWLWFFSIFLPRSTQLIMTFCYPDLRLTSASRLLLFRGFALIYLVAFNLFRVIVVNPPVVLRPAAFLARFGSWPLVFLRLHASSHAYVAKARHRYRFHAYDAQLHLSFDPSDSSTAVNRLSSSLADVRACMSANLLKLNSDNTELSFIGNPKRVAKVQHFELSISYSVVRPAASARNHTVIFDEICRLNNFV